MPPKPFRHADLYFSVLIHHGDHLTEVALTVLGPWIGDLRYECYGHLDSEGALIYDLDPDYIREMQHQMARWN